MNKPSDQPNEWRTALARTVLVLVALMVGKSLGSVPYIGTVAVSLAAAMQLWEPLRRCDAWQQPLSCLGLSTQHLRSELKCAFGLSTILLPLYAAGTYALFVYGRVWLSAWPEAAAWLPRAVWGWPRHFVWSGWQAAGWQAVVVINLVLTQLVGVALCEETFFRGYLQPQLQHLWPPRTKVAGVPMGFGVLVSCALFALAHVLGEWQPARLLPFVPGLLFAWQRNRRGSLVGCIVVHALCNLFGAAWFAFFRLVP